MTEPELTDAKKEFRSQRNRHLFFSLALDAIGMGSYVIPALAEVGDMIFAPIYAAAIFAMYRQRGLPSGIAAIAGFVEEILPTTDVIPSATLMWIYTYVLRKDRSLPDPDSTDRKEDG